MTTLSTDDPIFVFDTSPSADQAQQLEASAPGVTGIIASQQVQGETWMDTLSRSLPIMAATYQQKQILDVQVDRARQGLPPLNASQFAAGVQVGLTPDVKNILIMGGIGIVALMMFMRKG